jgi:ABC-type sugar transport system, periplasmic component
MAGRCGDGRADGGGSPTARADQITLNALMEDVPESQIIEAMLPDFEKETGIKVKFQRLVYSEMHDKLVTQLTGQSSFYNVLEVDFLWAGEFPEAGWLAISSPSSTRRISTSKPFIPAMMDLVGRHKGTLYMIPMYNYSMGLIYRTDLLGDAKIQAAYKSATGKDLKLPETLADYVELAKFMNANGGVTGSAMQGQRGDPNSMEFSNYLSLPAPPISTRTARSPSTARRRSRRWSSMSTTSSMAPRRARSRRPWTTPSA